MSTTEAAPRSRFLSMPQVAAELGCSRGTVYRLISRGVLPATRIGDGPLRVPRALLEQVIAEREQDALAAIRAGEESAP